MSLYADLVNSNHEQNCEQILNKITNMLHTAGSFLLMKTMYIKRNLELKTRPQWWDSQCDQLKLLKFEKLTEYRRTNNNKSLEEYKETRNNFRKLCKETKSSYALKMRNKLQTSSEKPKEFWSLIKSLTRKPKKSPDISGEQWYDYFNELLKRK